MGGRSRAILAVSCIGTSLVYIESGTGLDLVLVDVSLADGSGLDVARAASGKGVQVLFVTGNCPVEAAALEQNLSNLA